MIIQRIERLGNGVEVIVDGKGYYMDISKIITKDELKLELVKKLDIPDTFDNVKLAAFKQLEGTTVDKSK